MTNNTHTPKELKNIVNKMLADIMLETGNLLGLFHLNDYDKAIRPHTARYTIVRADGKPIEVSEFRRISNNLDAMAMLHNEYIHNTKHRIKEQEKGEQT